MHQIGQIASRKKKPPQVLVVKLYVTLYSKLKDILFFLKILKLYINSPSNLNYKMF